MAKDILVNTQIGDVIFKEQDKQGMVFNVVWGKILPNDVDEYMNIVVPASYIKNIRYDGDQYACHVKAEYYPVNEYFQARMVVKVDTDTYSDIANFTQNAPEPASCLYYRHFMDNPMLIKACQMPLVDINGEYVVVFKRYSFSAFTRAIIYSDSSSDLDVGQSDSQEVQLLTKCAPGKSYRFPTIGMDIVKYINSVVEHTDFENNLKSTFESDGRTVSSAAFDNETGEIDVVFSGTNIDDTEPQHTPEELPVELFRVADDEFVRALSKEAKGIVVDNAEFVRNLNSYESFYKLLDIEAQASVDAIVPTVYTHKKIDMSGNIVNTGSTAADDVRVASIPAIGNRIYELRYRPADFVKTGTYTKNGVSVTYWYHEPLFVLKNQNDTVVYIAPVFYTESEIEKNAYIASQDYVSCFIPLNSGTIFFYAGTSATYLTSGNGVYQLSDTAGNYISILGLSQNPTSGVMSAIVTNNSLIEEVQVDVTTNRIIILKQNS